jgi:adenine-specific DNA-methyltransferase
VNPIDKFKELLKEVFQFEAADLDFGIYRILNYKRDQIEKFIHEDLQKTVEAAFGKHKDERLENIGQRFDDVKGKILELAKQLGQEPFTSSGELKEEFRKGPLGRDYMELKAQKEEAEAIEEIRLQVFNDLYTFFSRYYEEGDFVPQYRYSIRNHRYAIPYNGEEVKLYWANHDQYYTKTGILFRDYAFFTDATKTYKVVFRTVAAKEELGSNKATKARFFVLDDETPWDMTNESTLVIRLQHRELSSDEARSFGVEGGSNAGKQEKINGSICDAVLKGTKDVKLKGLLQAIYKNETGLLPYQLARFTAKNTKDYFIHKDLKGFLTEQLDYFIKAEVISLETLERERFFDKHITRAKVVKEIGEKIIDFLTQIEDFQKRLWEKKKFVIRTDYVVTTDLVPKEFYPEILKNKAQLKEWKELGFETARTAVDLKERRLPVDTNHFGEAFKERLLEKLTEKADLDDLLDGLVIKSENWQGLNLLMEKYREKVKCIYIDPPYNTVASEILYKNNYKHSSWLSLITDRVQRARSILSDDGALCVAIDDAEFSRLHLAVLSLFGQDALLGTVAVRSNPAGRSALTGFSVSHDYAVFIAATGNAALGELPKTHHQISRYGETDIKGRFEWVNFRKHGGLNANRTARPKLFYPIYTTEDGLFRIPKLQWDQRSNAWKALDKPTEQELVVWPVNEKGEEKTWKWGHETAAGNPMDLTVRADRTGASAVYMKSRMREGTLPPTLWTDSKYSATQYGTNLLGDIMGASNAFSFPKSVNTVHDCLRVCALEDGEWSLDIFAGSGTTAHAVINLNRDDGGRRKYILIEMANYFETVLLPRIKKVVYSDKWKDGKPQNTNGISHFMKYQYLEQYEDTLDNIELKPNKTAQDLFGDDYLLKYFVDFETRENATLLRMEDLKNPFSYKLKVNAEEVGEPKEVIVDIPETFAYLIGLKLRKFKARTHKGVKYRFTLGEKEGKNVAVVWREHDDSWTEARFMDDKAFIIEELEEWAPHVVYINGQSVLTPQLGEHSVEIRQIEPDFKALMGG